MRELPAEPVEIRALGERLLFGLDGKPLDVTQPKRLALLFFLALAVPRGFHRRDTLLAMFWPEADRVGASRSLRQALHYLRGVLSPGVLVTHGSGEVGLDHARVRSDVARFDSLLDLAREEDALPLYRGELLPGFHLRTCPDFDRWLELERTRLRRRAVRASLVVSHRCAGAGDIGAATEWARNALRLAGWDEVVLHDAVHLLEGTGGRLHALRLAEWGAERIRAELDVDIGVQTLELIARLRADDAPLRLPGGRAATRGRRDARWRSFSAAMDDGTEPPRPPIRPRLSQEAYHEFVRGLHCDEQRTPASMRSAIQHYERAVRLEPNFALAHLGLARAWGILPSYAAAPAVAAYPLARHHASKALALDASLTEGYAWLAHVILCHEWDWVGAEQLLRRAVEQDESAPYPHVVLGMYLLPALGRLDEAATEIELARQLEPASLPINTYVGMVNFFGRRYTKAVEEARLVLDISPRFPLALSLLGMALEQLGEHREAVTVLEQAVDATAGGPMMRAQLARALATARDRTRAGGILIDVVNTTDESQLPHVFLAGAYARLGDFGAAMDSLHRAYRERSPLLVHIGVAPAFDPLRGESGFRELLLRMGLIGRLEQ